LRDGVEAGRPPLSRRSIKGLDQVKNRSRRTMDHVMDAFGRSPEVLTPPSWSRVCGERVRMHIPRVAQLTSVSCPTPGSCEAAQGQSHSFCNCWGHRSLPTWAITSSKGGIAD
jgi:hypothetical protein